MSTFGIYAALLPCRKDTVYSREYRLDSELYKPSSLHDVRVISTDDETEVAACILGASDGATGIHENSAIINGDSLIKAEQFAARGRKKQRPVSNMFDANKLVDNFR